jgi:hypothetical protein
MEREEVIQLADRAAAATPSLVWLVVYWQTTGAHEVIPEHEFSQDALNVGAEIVHVAHAVDYQLV